MEQQHQAVSPRAADLHQLLPEVREPVEQQHQAVPPRAADLHQLLLAVSPPAVSPPAVSPPAVSPPLAEFPPDLKVAYRHRWERRLAKCRRSSETEETEAQWELQQLQLQLTAEPAAGEPHFQAPSERLGQLPKRLQCVCTWGTSEGDVVGLLRYYFPRIQAI